MKIEYFYSKRRKLDFLKIHYEGRVYYVDGFGVAMLENRPYNDPVIEHIRIHAPAIMSAARRNIWGDVLTVQNGKGDTSHARCSDLTQKCNSERNF